MKKLQISFWLWLLIPAIIVLMIPVVIIDQATHSDAASVQAETSKPVSDTRKDEKIGTKVGDTAPDFQLKTLDNREIRLSDYRGKNVVLNFWASWCGPCDFEMPFLKETHEKWSKTGVVIIAINTKDSFEKARHDATTEGYKFLIPVDVPGNVAKMYNIRGMPTTFFINKNGVITSIRVGPFMSTDDVEETMKTFE